MHKKCTVQITIVLILFVLVGFVLLLSDNSYERIVNKYIDYYFTLIEANIANGGATTSDLETTFILDAELFEADKQKISGTLKDGWPAGWITIYHEDEYKEHGVIYYALIANTEENGITLLGMDYSKPGEPIQIEHVLNDKQIRSSRVHHYKEFDSILEM